MCEISNQHGSGMCGIKFSEGKWEANGLRSNKQVIFMASYTLFKLG